MLRVIKQADGVVRLTILSLGIALAGIWVVTLYANHAVREGVRRTLEDAQSSTASIIALQINDELQHRLNVLTTLASQLCTMSPKNAADIQAFLRDRPILQLDFNSGVFITNLDGTAVADFPVVPGRVGTNYIDREAVSVPIREGVPVIGRPYMGKTLKSPAFSITVPIKNAQGAVIGTVAGVVNLGLPNFLDRLASGSYGKSGWYLLIAPQYRLVVTASEKSRVMEVLPPTGENPEVDRMLEDQDIAQIVVNTKGVEVLSAGRTVRASGWRIVVSIPTDEAFASTDKLQQHVLLVAVIASFLGCVMAWWLLKSHRVAVLALYDPLTKLANRRLLVDRLGQTIAYSQRSSTFFAVMVLDLDNFKPLNDKHGHLAGDELLIEVANRLKRSVRDIDTVARFGGDEFVVVLGELGADQAAATDQARAVAEKIRMALAEPYRVIVKQTGKPAVAVEHHCTASVGVALGIDREAGPDEILKLADEAMYHAKKAGRNQVLIAEVQT